MNRDYSITRRCVRCKVRKSQTGGSYLERRFVCADCLRADPEPKNPQQPAKPARSTT